MIMNIFLMNFFFLFTVNCQKLRLSTEHKAIEEIAQQCQMKQGETFANAAEIFFCSIDDNNYRLITQ